MTNNQILKTAVVKSGKHDKQELLKVLGVDLQNAEPALITPDQYNRKAHENTIFLFIDDQFRIIGLLKGSIYEKKYLSISNYNYNKLPKNWKHMGPQAKYILAIGPELRKRFPKPTPKPSHRNDARRALESRLAAYKTKKYATVNDESIITMAQATINKLTSAAFSNDPEVEAKVHKLIWHSSRSIFSAIKDFADTIENFQRYQKDYKQAKLQGCESYYTSNYESTKLDIIKWHNELVG